MIKFSTYLPCTILLLLVTLAPAVRADEGTDGASSADEMVLHQHTAKSNATTTVVRTPSANASSLTELQKRKQESIQTLNRRAEDLVHAWKLRQMRQAIAEIKAQERKDAMIAAAAAAEEKAAEDAAREAARQAEAQRNKPTMPPVAPPIPTVVDIKPLRTVDNQTPTTVAPMTEPAPQSMPPQVLPQTAMMPEVPAVDVNAQPMPSMEEVAVEGPVDRLALSSSLFATESYKECLSILDAVDRKPLTKENRDWCDFLAAGCYRKLNNLPEAESRYRALLGKTEVSWLANATRWWLDHLNEQQKLRSDLQQLHTNFTAWQEEIDAFRNAD